MDVFWNDPLYDVVIHICLVTALTLLTIYIPCIIGLLTPYSPRSLNKLIDSMLILHNSNFVLGSYVVLYVLLVMINHDINGKNIAHRYHALIVQCRYTSKHAIPVNYPVNSCSLEACLSINVPNTQIQDIIHMYSLRLRTLVK